MPVIDTDFDVRSDAGTGDPDTTSPTLREYHRLLWSKRLPSGDEFTLEKSNRRRYLHHRSHLGEFFLASDTAVPTWRSWLRMAPIIQALDTDELDTFQHANHTIGGMLVFPGDRRPGTVSINGARGFSPQIGDRLDLTIECIRRHYRGEPNPLSKPLTAYDDFFRLFGDFDGFVGFFLLDDVLDHNGAVSTFLPFDDFAGSPLPRSVDEYRRYRAAAMRFIEVRNARIDAWARRNLGQD